MSDHSKIEWCDATWNVVSGCTQVSSGCAHCYAKTLHDRRHRAYLAGAKLPKQYAAPFSTIQLHPERLEMPLHWKKPRRIFVNSTSDLFHEDVPDYFIGLVFAIAALAPQHTFMILTKRPDRMETMLTDLGGEFWGTIKVNLLRRGYPLPADRNAIVPLPNVWLGVSVENQATADERIPVLLQTPAAVRFISAEPLLGLVELWDARYDNPNGGKTGAITSWPGGLDWVICGGESGPGARPMHPNWALSLRDGCLAAGVPFFFKQWGEWHFDPQHSSPRARVYMDSTGKIFECMGTNQEYQLGRLAFDRVGKKAAGRLLDGHEWNEFPEVRG